MTTPFMRNIEKMLADDNDDTLLRFSPGGEYLKGQRPGQRRKPPEVGGATGTKILRRLEAARSRPHRIGPARRRLGRLPRSHRGGRSKGRQTSR